MAEVYMQRLSGGMAWHTSLSSIKNQSIWIKSLETNSIQSEKEIYTTIDKARDSFIQHGYIIGEYISAYQTIIIDKTDRSP